MKWGTTKPPVYVYVTSEKEDLKKQLSEVFLEEAFGNDLKTLERIKCEYDAFNLAYPKNHFTKSLPIKKFLGELSGTATITISQNDFLYISIGFSLLFQSTKLKQELTHNFLNSNYEGWFLAQRKILNQRDVFIGDLNNLHLFLGINEEPNLSNEKILSLDSERQCLKAFTEANIKLFLKK